MSAKGLADRWRAEAGQALAEEVLVRLVANRPLDGLGLGQHEGRVDLRGFLVPPARRLQRFEAMGWFIEQLGDLVELHGARWEGLDLSGAQLQSLRLFDSKVVGCRFDGANCADWRLWGTEVAASSFAKANLHDAAVGTGHEHGRNAWRGVSFAGSDFRVAVAHEAVFEDCDFSGAKLTKVQFEQCELVRCRFAGKLSSVLFDGRDLRKRPAPPPMQDVDFSQAIFTEVEFIGLDLDKSDPARGPRHPLSPQLQMCGRVRASGPGRGRFGRGGHASRPVSGQAARGQVA